MHECTPIHLPVYSCISGCIVSQNHQRSKIFFSHEYSRYSHYLSFNQLMKCYRNADSSCRHFSTNTLNFHHLKKQMKNHKQQAGKENSTLMLQLPNSNFYGTTATQKETIALNLLSLPIFVSDLPNIK